MFDNHTYNLMNQLIQEHKSLWRIKNEYMKDSGDCESCKKMWDDLIEDKEEHIEELTELIKGHMC